MVRILHKPTKMAACGVLASFLAASNVTFAQQAQGWPSADSPNPYDQAEQQQPPAPYPPQQQQAPYAQQAPSYGPYYGPNQYAPPPVPAELTVSAGTYLNVRLNQELKADRDHPGAPFTATLVQPFIVNGVVVAQPGELVSGQVVDVQDSRGVRALGHYGLVLTNVTLVDGQQMPVQAAIVGVREHGPTGGQDVGTMALTTGLGAAIGGAIGWGTGAAIGAGVGALTGATILVNEHAHSNIKTEELMTFRIDMPVQISTASAPGAFHWVQPGEYAPPRPRYAYAPPPVIVAPYPYYYGSPYWYGPSFGFSYYGGGYRRHWR